MHTRLRLLSLLCVMALLTGCATTAKYRAKLNTWHGKDVNSLVHAWGYPNKIIKSPTGNQVYVYRRKHSGSYPITCIPGDTTVVSDHKKTVVHSMPGYCRGGEHYTNKCITWFELNKENRVSHTTFRGNDCVSY